MTILLSDPRVSVITVRENAEPLVALRVLEGYRTVSTQRAIVARYSAEVRVAHPEALPAECRRLTSRFVAPVAVAPHVARTAVEVTLVDDLGVELDLGTPVDATPEQSGGACYFAAALYGPTVRRGEQVACGC